MRRDEWRRWLDRVFGRRPVPVQRPRRLLKGPELLEDRSVPSVTIGDLPQPTPSPGPGPGPGDHDHLHPAEAIRHFQPPTTYLTAEGSLLSGPTAGAPRDVAMDFLRANAARLGFTLADLNSSRITSEYTDEHSGTTHIYLIQQRNGLDVPYATANISVTSRGEVISAGSSFVPNIATFPVATVPALSAIEALRRAAPQLDLPGDVEITPAGGVTISGINQQQTLNAPALSREPIPVQLTYTVTPTGLRLTWDMVLNVPNQPHWYNFQVDAQTGTVLAVSDWVDHASYNVFAFPVESPLYGVRTTVTDPWNPTYSPYGWHDTDGSPGAEFTDTRGNNVFAQEDSDGNNSGGFRPNGGADLNFDFPIDFGQAPGSYQSAAITNLFYWNNILHDIHAVYGFTEAAGNFQEMNYSGLGKGSDHVWADAQDGSGVNNANFATPPDGQNPRMQQFIFTLSNPNRDSDLDNGIIIHEYGHGVSNRLTGGPADANALNTWQSAGMGEGWSDFYALMLLQTAANDTLSGTPMGNYVLNESTSGPGIRRQLYSYSQTINTQHFGHYNGGWPNYETHNSGELWATALWDLNHLMIQKYGYDAYLSTGYNGNGTAAERAGNKLVLRLVMDAMKLQPANPTFMQARNAILAADVALTGGQNQYEIWLAFARRGLGTQANTANADATSLTTSFNTPPGLINASTNISTVNEGNSVTLSGSFADALPDFLLMGDPNLTQTHKVTIDWGDGTTPDVIDLAAGTLVFSKSHVYADNKAGGGATTITITVADQLNATATAKVNVTVNNLPPSPVITGAPASVQEGQQVSLSVNENDPGTGDTFTYAWTVLKDGSPYSTGSGKDFSFTPNDNGSYQVSVQVTDDDNGQGTSPTVTITGTNLPPVPVITGAPASVQEGKQVSLSVNENDPGTGDTFTYAWKVLKDGVLYATGNTKDFSFTPNDNGSYQVSVQVTDDDNGQGTSPAVTITGTNLPPVPVITGVPAESKEGVGVSLSVTENDPGSADTFTYAWTVLKNGVLFATGSDRDFTYIPDDNDAYQVSVTVTDDDGGQGTATVTINAANQPPVPVITGTPASSKEGVGVSLSVTENDPGSADTFTYAWTVLKDGVLFTSGTGKDFTYTPNDNGAYKVSVTVTDDDGGQGNASVTINATNQPPAPVITGVPASSIEGVGVSLSVNENDPGTGDTFTYAWTVLKNGSPFASGTGKNFTYIPDDNGTYKVSLTVTDDDGAQGKAPTQTIVAVNKAPEGAKLEVLGTVRRHEPATFTITGVVDASADIAAGLTYFFDFNGDGDFTDKGDINGKKLATADFVFTKLGEQVINARVQDKDGGKLDLTTTIVVERGGNQGVINQSYILAGTDTGDSRVQAFDLAGNSLFDFQAFPGFTGGVRVAAGDVNGDSIEDFVVARGPGRATTGMEQVRIFSGADGTLLQALNPYSATFTGGVNVASGFDWDSDDYHDIAVAPASGSGYVMVYSGRTGALLTRVSGFSGGSTIAVGDVTGDGQPDLVIGQVLRGSGLKVIDGATGREDKTRSLKGVFDTRFKGGIFVAAGDVDGDGVADMIIGSGADPAFQSSVKVISGRTQQIIWDFATSPGFTGGARVAAKDLDNDGLADFLIAPGPGVLLPGTSAPPVFGIKGNRLTYLMRLDPLDGFLGGVYVG